MQNGTINLEVLRLFMYTKPYAYHMTQAFYFFLGIYSREPMYVLTDFFSECSL